MATSIDFFGEVGIMVNCTGGLTGNEIINAYRSICMAIEGLEVAPYIIWNLSSAADISDCRFEALTQLEALLSAHHAGMITALVAETDLVYGLCRMWPAHIDHLPHESKVFRSMTNAGRWIQNRLRTNHRV